MNSLKSFRGWLAGFMACVIFVQTAEARLSASPCMTDPSVGVILQRQALPPSLLPFFRRAFNPNALVTCWCRTLRVSILDPNQLEPSRLAVSAALSALSFYFDWAFPGVASALILSPRTFRLVPILSGPHGDHQIRIPDDLSPARRFKPAIEQGHLTLRPNPQGSLGMDSHHRITLGVNFFNAVFAPQEANTTVIVDPSTPQALSLWPQGYAFSLNPPFPTLKPETRIDSLFLGAYPVTLSHGHTVKFPPVFSELGDAQWRLQADPHRQVIRFFPEHIWQKWLASENGEHDSDRIQVTERVSPDSHQRLSVPQDLRRLASLLDRDHLIAVGMGHCVELMTLETYHHLLQSVSADALARWAGPYDRVIAVDTLDIKGRHRIPVQATDASHLRLVVTLGDNRILPLPAGETLLHHMSGLPENEQRAIFCRLALGHIDPQGRLQVSTRTPTIATGNPVLPVSAALRPFIRLPGHSSNTLYTRKEIAAWISGLNGAGESVQDSVSDELLRLIPAWLHRDPTQGEDHDEAFNTTPMREWFDRLPYEPGLPPPDTGAGRRLHHSTPADPVEEVGLLMARNADHPRIERYFKTILDYEKGMGSRDGTAATLGWRLLELARDRNDLWSIFQILEWAKTASTHDDMADQLFLAAALLFENHPLKPFVNLIEAYGASHPNHSWALLLQRYTRSAAREAPLSISSIKESLEAFWFEWLTLRDSTLRSEFSRRQEAQDWANRHYSLAEEVLFRRALFGILTASLVVTLWGILYYSGSDWALGLGIAGALAWIGKAAIAWISNRIQAVLFALAHSNNRWAGFHYRYRAAVFLQNLTLGLSFASRIHQVHNQVYFENVNIRSLTNEERVGLALLDDAIGHRNNIPRFKLDLSRSKSDKFESIVIELREASRKHQFQKAASELKKTHPDFQASLDLLEHLHDALSNESSEYTWERMQAALRLTIWLGYSTAMPPELFESMEKLHDFLNTHGGFPPHLTRKELKLFRTTVRMLNNLEIVKERNDRFKVLSTAEFMTGQRDYAISDPLELPEEAQGWLTAIWRFIEKPDKHETSFREAIRNLKTKGCDVPAWAHLLDTAIHRQFQRVHIPRNGRKALEEAHTSIRLAAEPVQASRFAEKLGLSWAREMDLIFWLENASPETLSDLLQPFYPTKKKSIPEAVAALREICPTVDTLTELTTELAKMHRFGPKWSKIVEAINLRLGEPAFAVESHPGLKSST